MPIKYKAPKSVLKWSLSQEGSEPRAVHQQSRYWPPAAVTATPSKKATAPLSERLAKEAEGKRGM
jgi:hypothetical protein